MKALTLLSIAIFSFGAQATCEYQGEAYDLGSELVIFDEQGAEKYRNMFIEEGMDAKQVEAEVLEQKGLYVPYACAPLLENPEKHVFVRTRGRENGKTWYVY